MLAQDREAVCLVRWQDGVGAQQPSHRWPNGWNHDGNWNDPHGRILQHVDFNALGGSEEPLYLEPCDLAVSGDRLLVLCRGSLFGRICVLDSQTGAFLYQGPASAKPARLMSFACQGPSRCTRTYASLRIPIITRSKFSTFASGSS